MSAIRVSMIGPGQAQAARKLGAASLPLPSWDAGGWSSRGQVNGSPGTRGIPAPAPVPGLDREKTALAMSGNIGLPSSVFSKWFPSIYFNYLENIPPVSVYSDNQMPVPAVDPRGKPGVVMAGFMNRGQKQVPNVRVTPVYPKFVSR
jgi:hypothetical protein